MQTPPENNPFNRPQNTEVLPRIIERNGEIYINVKELKTMIQQSIHKGSPPEWTSRAIVRYMELLLCRGMKLSTWQTTDNEITTTLLDNGRWLKPVGGQWKLSLKFTLQSFRGSIGNVVKRRG